MVQEKKEAGHCDLHLVLTASRAEKQKRGLCV